MAPKRPKPSQYYVEVSSEDEGPRQHGALRGLNPSRDIINEPAATTPGLTGQDGVSSQKPHHHTTRSVRNGANPDVNYNMKFHPMDLVTRPNMAATRGKRFRSLSYADIEDDEDEDEAPQDFGTDHQSSDDQLSSDSPAHQVMPSPRKPDPHGVRRSTRSSAGTFRLYSKKYHPQDAAIEGFKRHGPYLQAINALNASQQQTATVRSSERDNGRVNSSQLLPAGRKPRKRLRSLDPNSGLTRPPKSSSRRSGTKSVNSVSKRDQEIDDLVEEVIRGTQIPTNASTSDRPEVIDIDLENEFADEDDGNDSENTAMRDSSVSRIEQELQQSTTDEDLPNRRSSNTSWTATTDGSPDELATSRQHTVTTALEDGSNTCGKSNDKARRVLANSSSDVSRFLDKFDTDEGVGFNMMGPDVTDPDEQDASEPSSTAHRDDIDCRNEMNGSDGNEDGENAQGDWDPTPPCALGGESSQFQEQFEVTEKI